MVMSEIKMTAETINTSSSVTKNDDETYTLRISVGNGLHLFEVTSKNVRDMVWAIAYTGLRAGCFERDEI
jgi:hypothetical protein